MQSFLDEIRHQRPSYGTNHIILHEDNGRPHLYKHASDYLESEGITTMTHPPNFPNLSPCDFWLFHLIKRNSSDHNDAQSLHNVINKLMYSLNKDENRKTFD